MLLSLFALHVSASGAGGSPPGPTVASAVAASSDRATLLFQPSSVGPGGLVTCGAHGLELLVSSTLNSTWVPAVVVFQSSGTSLTLQAPDVSGGCEQSLSAVRFVHSCPAINTWDKKAASGPCSPSVSNCSLYDGLASTHAVFAIS